MDADFLTRIAKIVTAGGGTVIVDEVFRLPRESASSLTIIEDITAIGSLSKMYGLPGLRLGWIAATRDRIRTMKTLQQYLTLSLNSVAVKFGSVVMKNAEKFSRRKLLLTNRRVLTDWVRDHHDIVKVTPPVGVRPFAWRC